MNKFKVTSLEHWQVMANKKTPYEFSYSVLCNIDVELLVQCVFIDLFFLEHQWTAASKNQIICFDKEVKQDKPELQRIAPLKIIPGTAV